ncbi:MAG TPA: DUF3842 family protein [Candidatus Eisenbergiella merdipullorum]|uniref:DUF3842 family protein n=1 Tax=Candidatus Eisenbergiella merdipullorum TaxID=2838553 RepID=A0A9D2I4F2_9FIRM|nr:DUF3842 family protein [Candidatus Eisenbergiella merdipullorum]
MKIVVIDGQGGRMGALLCEKIKKIKRERLDSAQLIAIGTNSAATAAMLKAGADCGATGENPVLVACRDADFIIGPLGILAADSLMGEVTPAMAVAVGSSLAQKILLPVNRCNHHVVGVQDYSMAKLTDEAVEDLLSLL